MNLSQSVFTSSTFQLHKRNIQIDSSIIQRYRFLSPFLNCRALFFEDLYYSIFYIQSDDEEEKEDEEEISSSIIIKNYIIDKLHKCYSCNQMNYDEYKRSLLCNQTELLKRSFHESYLHLKGYEYDLNHDINEWLNGIIYIDTTYFYHYGSKIISIEKDYTYV